MQISAFGLRPSTLEAIRRPHAGKGERRAACGMPLATSFRYAV
jgi:hypothetical protein